MSRRRRMNKNKQTFSGGDRMRQEYMSLIWALAFLTSMAISTLMSDCSSGISRRKKTDKHVTTTYVEFGHPGSRDSFRATRICKLKHTPHNCSIPRIVQAISPVKKRKI